MTKNLKFYLLFVAVFALAASISAQSSNRVIHGKLAHLPSKFLKSVSAPLPNTGFEFAEMPMPIPSVPPSKVSFRGLDETVGETYYDNQSNGTEQSRIHEWPDGEITATWTGSSSNETNGYADRGTGYNKRSAWKTGTVVKTRLETTTRTGFANYVVTASGVELVFAHKPAAAGAGYKINMLRRAPGATVWTETTVPTSVPKGQLWCKAAVDGETVYLLALTAGTASNLNGGQVYQGMDGHPLFWRSQDAGVTWDIQDGIIPGYDQTAFAAVAADSYAIDAYDGNVAVATFDSWNDTKIWKSSNKGTDWDTPLVVLDFPLEKYVTDKGYTLTEIGGVDPDGPGATNPTPSTADSLAIFANDGAGSILIDNVGQVHIWFGRMYVTDATLTDGGKNYYPSINGLLYWNESMATDDFILAGDIIDANGNNTIDNLNLGSAAAGTSINYNSNISGMATAGIDADGVLYVAYSALSDSLATQEGLSFRHVVTTKSIDGGITWDSAFDVHYLFDDIFFADYSEGVFPYCVKRVKEKFNFIFQWDNLPGIDAAVLNANEPADETSSIVFIASPLTTSTPLSGKNDFNLVISPNPTNGLTRLNFEGEKAAEASVVVMNSLGAVVSTRNFSANQGSNSFNLDTANLNTGLFLVRLNIGNQFVTQKLMVSKN